MNKDISEAEKASVSYPLKYACCFWVKHLCNAKNADKLLDSVKDFLENYQIFWFEVMSLVGKLKTAFFSLKELQAWLHHVSYIKPLLSSLLIVYFRLELMSWLHG